MIFQEKYFSRYILLSDQTSLIDYLYFVRYYEIYVLQLFLTRLWRHKSKFCLFNQATFLHDQKVKTKI